MAGTDRTTPTTRTGGVVAVHAHPDDETLTSGALLATWATAGLPVLVVTCTRGEQGEVIGPLRDLLEGDPAALGAHRETEIAAAMAALGGVEQVFLDRLPADDAGAATHVRYADSGMAWAGTGRAQTVPELPEHAFVGADLDEAATRLAGLLVGRRPDLVVTYEPGGGYGHPDHVRAHQVTRRAVEMLPPDDRPALAWAVVPAAGLRAGYRVLAGHPGVVALVAEHADPALRATRQGPLTLPDPDGALPAAARADLGAGLAVDVAPVLDPVLAALRAHATQVQAVADLRGVGGPSAEDDLVACCALSNGALAPVLATERYVWAPGHLPSRRLPVPPGARLEGAQPDVVA